MNRQINFGFWVLKNTKPFAILVKTSQIVPVVEGEQACGQHVGSLRAEVTNAFTRSLLKSVTLSCSCALVENKCSALFY